MKLTEIFKKLEKIAPVALSDEFCKKYKMYDNSGIIIDCAKEIKGVLFSLDLSDGAVDLAIERGYNLIVTHHPAIYGGVSRLTGADSVFRCIERGISVISMHLNFDVAPRGIDYHLMCGLGGKKAVTLSSVDGGSYGRVYAVEEKIFSDYLSSVKKSLSTERALGYGDGKRRVKKVASFCGAGFDDNALNFAVENGADVFVSSDLKHHEITAILHRGLNVIHLTHYSAENYGFNKIYKEISEGLSVPSELFTDGGLM